MAQSVAEVVEAAEVPALKAPALTRCWRLMRRASVLIPLLILIGTGLRGLDFGLHWDERAWQIGPVKRMVQTGILLPDYYIYPSFGYWLNSTALLPEMLASNARDESFGNRMMRIRDRMLRTLDTYEYLMRLRTIYLLVTSLAVVWVYVLVLRWRKSCTEALAAAAFLGLSWEVAYHLRWVATDGLLMLFGALTILLAMLSQISGRCGWLMAAAVTAGLGCGTKYPGGLLIVPVLVSGILSWDKEAVWRQRMGLLLKLCVIFAGVYLATTPATVLQPATFIYDVLSEVKHYSTGHGGHTIGRGAEHALRMLEYCSMMLFSHYPPIAAGVFGLAIVGACTMVRQERTKALLFLSFPVLYLLYFCVQRAMVVRNLLVVAPFLAVMGARGAAVAWEALERMDRREAGSYGLNLLRSGFVAAMVASLLINAGWLAYAAESIVQRRSDRFARAAEAYIATHKNERFFVSPVVRVHLAAVNTPSLPNVTEDVSTADYIVFYATEGFKRWQDWPTNYTRLTERIFGPYEVNFNYYSNWWGDDRIIVMSRDKALTIGIPSPDAENSMTLTATAGVARARQDHWKVSWIPPEGDPCSLADRRDAEGIIGSLHQQSWSRGWGLDGRACTYLGKKPVAVRVVLISKGAFFAQRADFGNTRIDGLGDEAYVTQSNTMGDVHLYVRKGEAGVLVKVHAAGDAVTDRLEVARRFAEKAVERLSG